MFITGHHRCKNDGDSKILNSLFANQQKWVKGSSAEEANKNLEKFLKNEGFDIDFKTCLNNQEIEDFVLKVENYKTALKADLTKQEDFTKLNDLQDFSENLSKLNKEVYEYALSTVCDRTSYYVAGGEIYYPFRKDVTFQSREDFKTKIKARIENYTNNLKNNASFGENANAKYQINTLIKNQKDVIKKLDFNILNNSSPAAI